MKKIKIDREKLVLLRKALPSPAQAKAGNYKKLHTAIDDLRITIENPKGSVRKGTDKEGNAWESTMEDHYGYILNAKGHDGDFLDCFVNPDIKPEKAVNNKVYIIKQIKKEDGSFDENKVMLGYESRDAARDGYLRNYDPSWFQLDSMEELTFEDFKNSIQSGYLKLEKSMKLKKVKFNKESVKKVNTSMEKLKKLCSTKKDK